MRRLRRHIKLLLSFLLLVGCTICSAQVVCIDPGHPSEVGEGTTGKKLTEMHAVWVEALLLKDLLEKKGMHVVLTKGSEKEFVRNKARAEVANKAHADYMVRLHCDSSSGSGFASYVPTQQGTSNGVRGPSKAVIDLSQEKGKRFHAALAVALKGKLRDSNGPGSVRWRCRRPQEVLTTALRAGALIVSRNARDVREPITLRPSAFRLQHAARTS
jgi:N-acetylmuramoyl-L-alanine amidase